MLKLKCKDDNEVNDYFFGNDGNHEVIYKNIVNSIELAYRAKEEVAHFAEITFIYGDSVTLDAHLDDWLENLTCALRYYESTEQYKKCSRIVNLIDRISAL